MSLQYKKIGLTARSDIADREGTVEEIAKIIEGTGATVLLDPKRCRESALKRLKRYHSTRELDLLVIIGGDGTILRTVREMGDFATPILSVNKGTIGFLAEIVLDEAEHLLPKLLAGKGTVEERRLLEISAFRGKKELLRGRVLNEAVVSQGAISRLIDLKAGINGEALTTFHADGVIIATPTGSTAYSLAAGGPIVHPELSGTILTPINPHSFSQKPIVIPADQVVDVTIATKLNKFSDIQVSLTLDGQTYISLKRGDRVEARLSRDTVKFVRRREDTFYETLRTKLRWGERLEDEQD